MKSFRSLPGIKSLGSVGLLAALAFYVGWPLYSGYEIKTALDRSDAPGLTTRIDFDRVRVSLRPAVAAKVDKAVSDMLAKAGTAGGALGDKLKAQIMPRIVDGVLATLVTPEMLIRIHASGSTLKEALDGLVADRASKSEGLGGFLITSPGESGSGNKLDEIAGKFGIDTKKVFGGVASDSAPPPAPAPEDVLAAKGGGKPKPQYGIGNIKQFSLSGPLGLTVAVARDPAARKPDLTAEMTFIDGGWKLTGLVPTL
jgi:hypothetical protein